MVTQSQSLDTVDGDGLSHPLNTPLNLTDMEFVMTSSGFHLNFDWSNCEWRPLNKKQITHVLTFKGDAGVAWLWFIGMTEFAGLTISSYGGWIMKIRLPETDHLELKRRLIQYGVLASHWDPNQLSQEIGIFTKKEYVEAQVQLLPESDDLTLI